MSGELLEFPHDVRGLALNLEEDKELGWDWSVRQFLNKWGFWEVSKGYSEDWTTGTLRIGSPFAEPPPQKHDEVRLQ